MLTHLFKGQRRTNKHICVLDLCAYTRSVRPHFPTFLRWNLSILVPGVMTGWKKSSAHLRREIWVVFQWGGGGRSSKIERNTVFEAELYLNLRSSPWS